MISLQESIPSWSPDALAAQDIFYSAFNDVNFYVEDKDQENLYLLILKRLFPKIRITQIFPLGGKKNVIAHANDPENQLNTHRAIYLVDKDFDDLLGHLIHKDNLFYLPKYCIENFLLEEDGIIEFAVEVQPKKTRDDHAKKLAYSSFKETSIDKLELLFRLFFVVQRLNLGLKNCDHPPERFSIKNHPAKIDGSLINKYQVEVKNAAMQTGLLQTENDFDSLVSKAFPKESAPDTNISGKFLMALTMHHIKQKLKCANFDLDSLTYRLARHSKLLDLTPLAVGISNYLGRNINPAH
jgi:hypothetical protein